MDNIKLRLNMSNSDDIEINGIKYIICGIDYDVHNNYLEYELKRYDKYVEENTIKKDII